MASFGSFFGSGGNLWDPLDLWGGTARQYNSAEAQKQRDWQERMSNTAHQREAADLEAAGLNRTLAATEGATTPGGSAASLAQNNSSGSVLGAFTSLLKLKQEQQIVSAQSNLMNSEAKLNKVRTENETNINPGENPYVKLMDDLEERIPEFVKNLISGKETSASRALSKKGTWTRFLFDAMAKARPSILVHNAMDLPNKLNGPKFVRKMVKAEQKRYEHRPRFVYRPIGRD